MRTATVTSAKGAKPVLAHRWIFEEVKGPIGEELHGMHTCDVRSCVNPDHIVPGTPRENVHDCRRKRRNAVGSRMPTSKLTEPAVAQGRALGMSPAGFAKHFGVHIRTAHAALSGKTWAHVRMLWDRREEVYRREEE